MPFRKNYDINQLRDYSTLFTRSEAVRWYRNDFASLQLKINRYNLPLLEKKHTYLSYLKHIYCILERFYPNEYIYKNEFICKWLLEEIGANNSVIFNEFRLGKAVADLAMFNGVSKVFEIKTLLDKEARLSNQLEQYQQLFNEVYLIIPEVKCDMYLKRESAAGIIVYQHELRGFSLVRHAQQNSHINVNVLMEVLHTHEYIKIVEQYFGERPKFNDFNKFQICKELIAQIPIEVLNRHFIELIKERKIHNEFSRRAGQLNQLFLSMNYSAMQKRHLLSNLSTTIC